MRGHRDQQGGESGKAAQRVSQRSGREREYHGSVVLGHSYEQQCREKTG
jgi:hypothetical protein